MSKRLWVMLLSCLLVLNMTIPVFASESEGRNSENGIASGETMLSGEIAYTTAYTLTIPSSINDMDLSQDAETTVGNVKVTKQNNNAEFDPAKKVSVTVDYTGELENSKNSNNKIRYKLKQIKGDAVATDITTDSKLDFSASEIEAGNVAYNLNAIVTATNKAGGTYSGTINFSAQVENATISFTIKCLDKDEESDEYQLYSYEVEPGTTWRQFANSDATDNFKIVDGEDHVTCKYKGDVWILDDSTKSRPMLDDLIKDNGLYIC